VDGIAMQCSINMSIVWNLIEQGISLYLVFVPGDGGMQVLGFKEKWEEGGRQFSGRMEAGNSCLNRENITTR